MLLRKNEVVHARIALSSSRTQPTTTMIREDAMAMTQCMHGKSLQTETAAARGRGVRHALLAKSEEQHNRTHSLLLFTSCVMDVLRDDRDDRDDSHDSRER